MAMTNGSKKKEGSTGKTPTKRSTSSNRLKSKTTSNNLPWWIELFFVQIGLPEALLVKVLSYRKKSLTHISENKRSYGKLLLAVLVVFYTYPLIRYSSYLNKCVNYTQKEVAKSMSDLNGKLQIAVRICNGSNIN